MIRLFVVLFILFKGNDGSAFTLVGIFYVETAFAKVTAFERAADDASVVTADVGFSVGQIVLVDAGIGIGTGGVFQWVDQCKVNGTELPYRYVDVNVIAPFVDVAVGLGKSETAGGVHPAVYQATEGVLPFGSGGGHQGRVYGSIFGACQAGEKREQE